MVASRSALVAFIFTAIAEELDHLARFMAEDMRAEHAIGRAVDDELHDRMFAPARQRRLHRAEARAIDVDDVVALARLGLRQADGADFGRREHRARHVLMVDGDRLAAEHVIGEGMALADRHRRQIDAVGDVADRVNRRDIGLPTRRRP